MIVRIYRILTVVFLAVALIGSSTIPRRDLRTTGQVAGIALDEADGQIKATFELYVPAVDAAIGTKRKTVVGLGNTLEECIENAQKRNGEKLFVNDAAALVIQGTFDSFLIKHILDYFSLLKHDHMDLPVFFTFGQAAAEIYDGEGSVISTSLVESAKSIKQVQTVKNLMNGIGERVLISGVGGYEIIS